MVPPTSPITDNPRNLPGRIPVLRYLREPPSSWALTFIAAALDVMGIVGITVYGFLGLQIIGDYTGALLGVILGFLQMISFWAIAQAIRIFIRLEENTRLTKDLLYYLLMDKK